MYNWFYASIKSTTKFEFSIVSIAENETIILSFKMVLTNI